MSTTRILVLLAINFMAIGGVAAGTFLPLCPDGALCATDIPPFIDDGRVLLSASARVAQAASGQPLSRWVSLATLDATGTSLRDVSLKMASGNYVALTYAAAKIFDATGNLLYTSNPSGTDGFSLALSRPFPLGQPIQFGGADPRDLISGIGFDFFDKPSITVSRDEGRSWQVQRANIRMGDYVSYLAGARTPTAFAVRAHGQGIWVIPGLATPGLWQTPTRATVPDSYDFTRLERVDDGSFPVGVRQLRGRYPQIGLPEGFFVALTDEGMYQSTNAGKSWSRSSFTGVVDDMMFPFVTALLTPDIRLADTNIQLIAARGRLFISRDRAGTWTEFAHGLPADRYTLGSYEDSVVGTTIVAGGAGGVFVCRGLNCDGAAFEKVTTMTTSVANVVEFYQPLLDHYFITADESEKWFVRSGGAGVGWTETGQSFWAWSPARTQESAYVCRFYGDPPHGPNSHFYTASVAECRGLIDLQSKGAATAPRWNSEGYAFKVSLPDSAGQCPADLVPVYRAYNDGFATGKDSNHRFVLDRQLLLPLIRKGWKDEGIAFCVPASG